MDKAPSGIRLSERQRLAWLRLIRSDQVGPITFRELINQFGSAERALEMLPDLSRRGGSRRVMKITTLAEAEREIDVATAFGAQFLGIGEPGYPPALRAVDGAPPLIAVKGDLAVTGKPGVGIVGSRNASITGAKFARMMAHDLGRAGYAIVSGLARGIDAAAHEASLETGTIAALAGSLDRPYPPENLELYKQICAGPGLAVSEMPFGWEPRGRDFPRRNRLIAGMSLGLIVVEAAMRSGSLITARQAGEIGRLVFAVPGSPLDPRANGTNRLLKDGAIVTTGADDVIEALAPVSNIDSPPAPFAGEDSAPDDGLPTEPDLSERARIIDALGPTPVEIDDIIRHTGLSAQTVHLVLLELDLAGRLHRHPGGYVSLSVLD